jgi:hypothetical protein
LVAVQQATTLSTTTRLLSTGTREIIYGWYNNKNIISNLDFSFIGADNKIVIVMRRWSFRNYVQVGGKNRVRKWYLELTVKEQAKLDRLIAVLEQQEYWKFPQYKALSDVRAGLGEIRWKGDGKQLRLLGWRGPGSGQYTLLLGCSHKGNRYTPTSALETATSDLALLEQDIGETCEHESNVDSETENK